MAAGRPRRGPRATPMWSTLEDTRRWMKLDDPRMPTLMGRYKVPHFDAKGEADQTWRDSGVPTTFLLTSFYWDNLITSAWARSERRTANSISCCRWASASCLESPPRTSAAARTASSGAVRNSPARTVGISGGHLTGKEMAASLTRALGQEVRYQAVTPAAYRGFGFPGADDLGNMFQFNHDFSDDFCAARSVEFSRSLNPALQSFDAWLAANAKRIPIG